MTSVNTIALLIVKEYTMVYERYFHGHSKTSISLSFSVTKAFFSALVGIAIEDGYIGSIEQPVTDYIPEIAAQGFGKVTLKHLLQMTSGMGYGEHGLIDNPFGKQARLSYTQHIAAELVSVRLHTQPGTVFRYQSIDNALLGMAMQRALAPTTITAYMQKKIWTPIGMESEVLWSTDRELDGMEKTWCCISATARDLAKFGRLYLRGGDWDGKTVVPRDWVANSTRVDTTEGSPAFYPYG